MLEQLRKKRISISKSIEGRERISSVERRKMIQANLEQFKREKYSRPNSPRKSMQQFYRQSSQKKNQSNPFLTHQQFPTFKQDSSTLKKGTDRIQDENKNQKSLISPKKENESKQEKQIEKQQQNEIKQQQQQQVVPENQKEQQKKAQQQSQEKVQQPQQPQPEQINNAQQNNPNPKLTIIIQNQQPQSATITNKEPQKQKHVKFLLPQFHDGLISPVHSSSIHKPQNNKSSELQPTYNQPKQDTLNFNYNDSHYGSSSNNSSAIFFTSQFKQYLNRDKQSQGNSPPKKQQEALKNQKNQRSSYVYKQSPTNKSMKSEKYVSQSFLKIGEDDVSEETQGHAERRMKNNQSGRSLAFSNSQNQSELLKYSHPHYNQEAVQDMVNKKLDEQLVLEIGDFPRNKFISLVNNYLIYQGNKPQNIFKNFTRQFKKLNKITKIANILQKSVLRDGFDEILIFNQYAFQLVKNDLKADKFLQEKNQQRMKRILQEWKSIINNNQAKAIGFQMRKDAAYKKNIFKVFRMILFDAKVAKQADLYYLSKLFTAWRNVAGQEKKKNDHIALKQYCRSLKRTYFYKIMQGTDMMRRQRQNNDAAIDFRQYSLLKRHFDAWLSSSSQKQPQYISIAMISKNTFKETSDHKWLKTRTVDFKQIK